MKVIEFTFNIQTVVHLQQERQDNFDHISPLYKPDEWSGARLQVYVPLNLSKISFLHKISRTRF